MSQHQPQPNANPALPSANQPPPTIFGAVQDQIRADMQRTIAEQFERNISDFVGSYVQLQTQVTNQYFITGIRDAYTRLNVRTCHFVPKRRGYNSCMKLAMSDSQYCSTHRRNCEREDLLKALEQAEHQRRQQRQEQFAGVAPRTGINSPYRPKVTSVPSSKNNSPRDRQRESRNESHRRGAPQPSATASTTTTTTQTTAPDPINALIADITGEPNPGN